MNAIFTTTDIQLRKQRLAAAWQSILSNDEVVLIHSGTPIQKPGGLDQNYPFLPHPSYFWLTGRRREGEVVLYSKNSGWIEFQKAYTRDQLVWEGNMHDLLVDDKGMDVSTLDEYLKKNKFSQLYHLGQSGQPVTAGKTFDLRTALDQTRRKKDAAEIRFIKQLADIAGHGYGALKKALHPGITEKEVQVIYESEIFRRGAQTVPYDSIVGAGTNAAILHALPTQRIINENEFVLVDAGVDVYDYCVDITRTYGSSANMSAQHKALYQLVYSVQMECIELTKSGNFWRDVHSKAATLFTEGLLSMGILKGNLSDLIEKQVISVFFPHGLGHLVGIRVRDTGHEENINPKTYFGARLRVDIQLEEGHLITVEPGVYFIKALLEAADTRDRFNAFINWNELSKWMHIGGVRIEDNILVTKEGNENLTQVVEKLADI
ncbi:MAG: M24 family metallopeptidase [Bacteroidetes bacterium]|nr:M24 family metallopeptidase [Bacteroidota bacterium]